MSWVFVAAILIVALLAMYNWSEAGGGPREREAEAGDTRWLVDPLLKSKGTGIVDEFLVRPIPEVSYRASLGSKVYLLPEPSNKVDPNAIIVTTAELKWFGYIAREENKDLSKYLLSDGKYYAQIIWVGDRNYIVELYTTRLLQGGRKGR